VNKLTEQLTTSVIQWSPLFDHARRCQSTLRALRGGNGTGLSTWGAQEAWLYATLSHPYRNIRAQYGRGLVLAFNNNHETIRRLQGFASRENVEHDGLDFDGCLILKNGNIIQLVHVDRQHPERTSHKIAGYDYDWIWADGIPVGSLLKEVMWGHDNTHGMKPVWLTFTPIGDPAAVASLRTRMEGDSRNKIPPCEKWTQHIIQLSPSNCPWRDPHSIQKQIVGCSRDEIAQRIFAMWENTTAKKVAQ